MPRFVAIGSGFRPDEGSKGEQMRSIRSATVVAALVAAPTVALAVPAAAATSPTGPKLPPLTLAIPATPLSTAGLLVIQVLPPDVCTPGTSGNGGHCVDLVPGLVQVSLLPPEPV
jgi:hypothetical protein